MRMILTILLVTVTGYGYSQNNKKTSWEYDKLKSEVKSIKTIAYDALDTLNQVTKGKIIDDVYGSVLIKYNCNGKWTEYRSFNPDGSNRWAELPILDKKDNMIERYDYTYLNSDSTLFRKYINQFDINDNLVESVRFNGNDSIIEKYIYKYDVNRNVLEMLNLNFSDSLNWRVISKYDKKNNLIEATQFDSNGVLNEMSTYKYDDKGNMIEKCVYDTDKNLENSTTYSYNEKRDLTEVCFYRLDGCLEKKTAYEYKYDFKDNWIEKVDSINEKVMKITERKIEYY